MKKFLKILRYILPYKYLVLLIVLLNVFYVFSSLFSFAMAIPFLGILFDNQEIVTTQMPLTFEYASIEHNFNYFLSQIIINQGKSQALLWVSGILVTMVFLKTGFIYLSSFFMAGIRNNIIRDIRNALYEKVIKLPLSYFSEEKKGDIIARMTGDVQEIETSVVRSIQVIFKEPITIIVYLGSLILISPHLTLFVFILLPIAGIAIGQIGKNLRKKSHQAQTLMGTLISVIEETLGGLRIIKAFNAENKVTQKFKYINQKYNRIIIKVWRRSYLATPISEFMGTTIVVIIMWYGSQLVLNNQGGLSSQAFIGYLIIFSQIINPAKAFSNAYYNIQKGMAAADRINIIQNANIKINEIEHPKKIEDFSEKIDYKNVSFKYAEDYVLRNINLTISKGKSIALVGQSGSGKSTLVDLLPRFYDIEEGEITIDTIPIKELSISNLRHLMGNVNQESILFNDTIFNNIAFGYEKATPEQVENAAKIANAHEFIVNTEHGYQTNIGDRGSKLSGGQRQRLSIARAVLKNPPILILDEATSALDTESERLVQEALNNLMKDRTSIVIAHRLSTVVNADLICVLHEGEIVERGTHQELLKKNGIYRKLNDLQMFE